MQECNFQTQDWEGGSFSLLNLGDYIFFPLLSFRINPSEVTNSMKMLTKVNCLHHCSLIWQISSRGLNAHLLVNGRVVDASRAREVTLMQLPLLESYSCPFWEAQQGRLTLSHSFLRGTAAREAPVSTVTCLCSRSTS